MKSGKLIDELCRVDFIDQTKGIVVVVNWLMTQFEVLIIQVQAVLTGEA